MSDFFSPCFLMHRHWIAYGTCQGCVLGTATSTRDFVGWIAQILDAHSIEYEDGDLDIARYALEGPYDEHIITRLQEKYYAEDVAQQMPLIRKISDELRRNPMFQPLFRR
jgi:hypothetical protein